ncbi:isoflavone reductase homolog [Olea europaea var. sylvestris]|uniref:isoflavone reductase homolog n=1 Tax=Olea europaea var. sylvestris TaxID=158386 RepID=UPI000C1D1A2F|nr:isoflavone reductase homolog [Olea europaea var. sylvestris]
MSTCVLSSIVSERLLYKLFKFCINHESNLYRLRDIATYTIKSIDDPRTLNKTLYPRPPENILTQTQLVEKWEKLTGKTLEKISILQKTSYLRSKVDFVEQVGLRHFYDIFYEGCLTNFEIGENGAEASDLYPEVQHTRIQEYLKAFSLMSPLAMN